MKKITQLIDECRKRNWHISIAYQNATSHSVEIYTGYVEDYKAIFITDGHVTLEDAVEKAFGFINNYAAKEIRESLEIINKQK